MLDQASDLHASDYPYGELGVDQRSRNLAGSLRQAPEAGTVLENARASSCSRGRTNSALSDSSQRRSMAPGNWSQATALNRSSPVAGDRFPVGDDPAPHSRALHQARTTA